MGGILQFFQRQEQGDGDLALQQGTGSYSALRGEPESEKPSLRKLECGSRALDCVRPALASLDCGPLPL